MSGTGWSKASAFDALARRGDDEPRDVGTSSRSETIAKAARPEVTRRAAFLGPIALFRARVPYSDTRPRSAAKRKSCVLECTDSFRLMLARCVSTVLTEMESAPEIDAFE